MGRDRPAVRGPRGRRRGRPRGRRLTAPDAGVRAAPDPGGPPIPQAVDVVLPVRDAASLLGPCLAALAAQATAADVRVIVVDDASTDDSVAVAEAAGVEVLRLPDPRGPYAARNVGWRAGSADVVAFTDVRCRVRPGWIEALLAPLDAGAAVAGGDTWALPGDRPAERFAHRRQLLRASDLLADEHLPYLATCNLATTRSVLEAVDGFREVRSGGDVDLCWRVQLAGLGAVVHAPGADVDWVPRTTVRAVLSQWSRYGRSRVETLARFADHGFTVPPPPPRTALARVALGRLRDTVRTAPGDVPAELVERAAWLAYWRTYRRAYREHSGGSR